MRTFGLRGTCNSSHAMYLHCSRTDQDLCSVPKYGREQTHNFIKPFLIRPAAALVEAKALAFKLCRGHLLLQGYGGPSGRPYLPILAFPSHFSCNIGWFSLCRCTLLPAARYQIEFFFPFVLILRAGVGSQTLTP